MWIRKTHPIKDRRRTHLLSGTGTAAAIGAAAGLADALYRMLTVPMGPRASGLVFRLLLPPSTSECGEQLRGVEVLLELRLFRAPRPVPGGRPRRPPRGVEGAPRPLPRPAGLRQAVSPSSPGVNRGLFFEPWPSQVEVKFSDT
jgi:hypothetical protein